MEFVLTPEQMGAADRATIEAGTPVEVLVDRAGGALARAVRDVLGGTYGRRVVVVCGKGNNGGDGRVAAGVLEAWGTRTEVLALDPARARAAHQSGGLDREELLRALGRADAAVDAMYGTGFRGVLEGDAAFAAQALNESGVPVVACDIPSGVDGLTGAVEGAAVNAVLTVCLASLKTGLLFEPGRSHAGLLRVAPIGVTLFLKDGTRVSDHPAYLLDEEDVALLLPDREPETHKWAVGGLFVVAGQRGMLGAANLVARSALRAGAGVVVLGLPGAELAARAGGSEVITRGLAETAEGFLDEPAAKEVLDGLDRFSALVVGPGLGTDERTVAAIRCLVAEAPVPLLVDADGLNALAGDLVPLVERQGPSGPTERGIQGPVVLTPHAGEFARLTGEPLGDDRLGAARDLAARTGAVVLLKGSTTVVAEPGGRAVLNRTGGPWLATAGTGDVLAGIVGGLLAQGVAPFEAAAAGAWLHGMCVHQPPESGGWCTHMPSSRSHEGLVAGDLVDAIPGTLARVRAAESS